MSFNEGSQLDTSGVDSGSGDDTVNTGAGDDLVFADAGNDSIGGMAGPAPLRRSPP